MGWKLLQTASSQEAALHSLQFGQTIHLVLDGGPKERFGVVANVNELGDQRPLARIDVGPWGLKVMALGDGIQIKPRHARLVPTKDDLPVEPYDLQPASANGHIEVVFLRENDRILLSKTAVSLKVAWDSSEIQVNSSINGEEIAESDDLHAKEDDQTEDEDLGQTVITTTRPLSHSTPMPSVARSDVIQETPTADRVTQMTDVSMSVVNRMGAIDNKPTPEDAARPIPLETFSTAPTKPADDNMTTEDVEEIPQQSEESPLKDPAEATSTDDSALDSSGDKFAAESLPKPQRRTKRAHPAILIPKKACMPILKRPSPDADNEMFSNASSSGRPSKRTKKNDDDDDDGGDVISKPASKRKKRVTLDVQDTTPNSTRDVQPSITDDNLYQGPKPRVALSNSGLPTTGNAIKFLKKQGGALVENVKGEACNILCVKDGILKKSMKLLLCVALGVPIVSDEWLLDSAKDGHFLDLEAFRPHFPAQERDWNFSFEDIWKKPKKEVFHGYNVYFTPALKATYKPFSEVDELCKAAGARRALSKLGKEIKDKDIADNTILLALNGDDDEDAVTILNNGYTCYTRDLLTLSILRGELDLESEEFKIKPAASNPPKKRGRPRKN